VDVAGGLQVCLYIIMLILEMFIGTLLLIDSSWHSDSTEIDSHLLSYSGMQLWINLSGQFSFDRIYTRGREEGLTDCLLHWMCYLFYLPYRRHIVLPNARV